MIITNRCVISFVLFYLLGQSVLAQSTKPAIDTSAYENWASVGDIIISNDGRFVMYAIENEPIGSKTVVLKSMDDKWQCKYEEANLGGFTDDNSHAYIRKADHSILIDTKSRSERTIDGEINVKYSLIFYRPFPGSKNLVIENLATKMCVTLQDVYDFYFIEKVNSLFFFSDNNNQKAYLWYDLSTGKLDRVECGGDVDLSSIIVSTDLNNVAYFKKENNAKELHVYNISSKLVTAVIREDSFPNIKFEGLTSFCAENKNILINIDSIREKKQVKSSGEYLKIWSYNDATSHSDANISTNRFPVKALLDVKNAKIIPVSFPGEGFKILSTQNSINWASIEKYISQSKFDRKQREITLVSLVSGKRISIPGLAPFSLSISTYGKYFIYYDLLSQNYFTYEISTGRIRNISSVIKTKWSYSKTTPANRGVASWTANDSYVIIYDQFDIWQIDPLGIKNPINLTSRHGVTNSVRYSLINGGDQILEDSECITTGFDLNTKKNGFFRLKIGISSIPKQLVFGDYCFWLAHDGLFGGSEGFKPLKAKSSNRFIVRRMSAVESPNYFSTEDFIRFEPLSNVFPEKSYNWLKSELHTFDKKSKQKGILYKPENFDDSKQYPVIIWYYQNLTNNLNNFQKPQYGIANIDIATYVSKGYLIFCPDIEYGMGNPGERALKAVTRSGRYLMSLKYVNSKKIGLQGHSFGGYETNYIITHSTEFAAAFTGCGISNWISLAGSIDQDVGLSRHDFVRNGQPKIGLNLWKKRGLYIKSSPIFFVDKVVTPVLIFHGDKDPAVPFAQAVEFFSALRYLNKKSWMLEYPDMGHYANGDIEKKDLTVRVEQFFNHFLKDAPSPEWMTCKDLQ